MRGSKFLGFFLDSVNVAAVGVMLAVLFTMSTSILFADWVPEWRAIIIAVLGFFFVFGPKKLNSMWIVLGGGVLGYLLSLV